MFKRTFLSTALAVGTLVALSGASEARDCRRFDRLEVRTGHLFDRSARLFRRTGDAVVRTGDRTVGWLFHRRNRV